MFSTTHHQSHLKGVAIDSCFCCLSTDLSSENPAADDDPQSTSVSCRWVLLCPPGKPCHSIQPPTTRSRFLVDPFFIIRRISDVSQSTTLRGHVGTFRTLLEAAGPHYRTFIVNGQPIQQHNVGSPRGGNCPGGPRLLQRVVGEGGGIHDRLGAGQTYATSWFRVHKLPEHGGATGFAPRVWRSVTATDDSNRKTTRATLPAFSCNGFSAQTRYELLFHDRTVRLIPSETPEGWPRTAKHALP